jgi:hypothetical protein
MPDDATRHGRSQLLCGCNLVTVQTKGHSCNQNDANAPLIYDTETETIYPVGKPFEFVARACPTVGPLFARAPELEAALRRLYVAFWDSALKTQEQKDAWLNAGKVLHPDEEVAEDV